MQWINRFFNTFAEPNGLFLTPWKASGLPDVRIMAWSHACAADIGLTQHELDWPAVLAGNAMPEGAQACATVYSGHQFGHWAGQLGDGRALLLGEVSTERGSFELQLKGSGRTPYSRGGDGRAVLRSSIREFLCSEAMAGLGISTTRALAIAQSPQPVIREAVESAAVVLRTAPSFIRFGHFEHFAASNQQQALQKLADFVCEHHIPQAAQFGAGDARRYLALLGTACERSAKLVADWQAVGFCHGVLNTDNMSILGLTLDYGPFGFLDTFDAHHICNHTDEQGRYSYARQAQVVHWNLGCLAQALSLLVDDHEALASCLKRYATLFNEYHCEAFSKKLGLSLPNPDLLAATLQCLHEGQADFTLFFRQLSHCVVGGDFSKARDVFVNPMAFDAWLPLYLSACQTDGLDKLVRSKQMLTVNPKYVLRNHLAETAIRSAADHQDTSKLQELLKVLACPYDEQPEYAHYANLPPDWAKGLSVSCSS